MPALDLTIRARRIVLPDGERAGAVVVRDGVIAEVLDEAAAAAYPPSGEVLDVPDDCVLMPGLVDSHVHVNEPGRTEWEGFATATAAAAAGGVTTIVDMPLNSIPPTVDVAALEAKRAAAAGQCAVDVAFWGGAVPGNVDDLEPLHEAGVVGFKCFLLPSGCRRVPAARRRAAARGHAPDRVVRRPADRPRRGRRADRLASRPTTSGRPTAASSPPGRRRRRRRRSTTCCRRPARPAAARTSCTCPRPRPSRRWSPPRPRACR